MNDILSPLSNPIKSYGHIAMHIDYSKGKGIYMHFTLSNPTDFGVQYGICEFDHNPTILIERYDRLTPTCKRRLAELQQKLADWAVLLTDAYEKTHQEKDIFATIIAEWAASAPATPPKQEDKVDTTDFKPDPVDEQPTEAAPTAAPTLPAVLADASVSSSRANGGWFLFLFHFDEEEQAA